MLLIERTYIASKGNFLIDFDINKPIRSRSLVISYFDSEWQCTMNLKDHSVLICSGVLFFKSRVKPFIRKVKL